ncbi:phosphopentomutase-like [Oncorhynchus nerka]|uniref:phosphopentomutase-like n=1 Tax=Oncorhynchus nerka TaxID=8023 RepID=UPI0031B7F55B
MENVLSSTGDGKLDQAINQWLQFDENPQTVALVQGLVKEGAVGELRRCFGSRMEFGTAGLRAAMGPGISCMNDLTIIQTTQGFCKYLEQCFGQCLKERGVVVGFDARAHPPSGGSSRRFASLAAAVFTCRGVPVHLFCDITPTPFVPFAVSHLGLCAGVMVTASHNPKQDNGYKVYWENGAQIVPPHDKGISVAIEANLEPWPESWDITSLSHSPLLKDPFQDIHTEYYRAIQQHCHHRDINKSSGGEGVLVSHTLREEGDTVLQQKGGQWRVFSGNELGALLGWWVYQCWKQTNPDQSTVKSVYMLASTVSSKILRAIALKEGFHFEETLTGFKWMGNRARELLDQNKIVLFAFEEAIGYMCGSAVLDKDGVSAAAIAGEMTSYLAAKNITLSQQLTAVYEEYGYHITKNSYFICHDQAVIRAMFDRLRHYGNQEDVSYPRQCGGVAITAVRDLTTGYDSSQADNKAVLPPPICYTELSGVKHTIYYTELCVAPGNRYKHTIYYTELCAAPGNRYKHTIYYTELCAAPGNSDVAGLQKELDDLVNAIVEDFFQPQKNNLLSKPE